MTTNAEETKNTILRFVSSEMAAHTSNLIGISVILFSYLTAAVNRFPRVSMGINLCDFWFWAYLVIFLIFWLLNSGIVFVIGRLSYYGNFADEVIMSESTSTSLKTMWEEIAKEVKERKLPVIHFPVEWWQSGIARPSKGFAVSFIIGFVTAIMLFLAFFLKP